MPFFRTLPGKIAAYLTALIIGAYWVCVGGPRNWAVTIPDATHTYGIRTARGVDLFFRPPIGWIIEHGLWVVIGAAMVTLLVEMVARTVVKTTAVE
ncbi:MAG: hypothetical protein JSU08_12570 [Acidobacteria bacterium]|nr:hypothetical protein [Acidobacteriota bacterium]